MAPLDPKILSEARTSRDRLLEAQHEAERARADYNDSVRRLHAAGGSLREIAENLSLSHQRVHQIVEGGEAAPGGRRGHRGGPRQGFTWPFERFTRRARQVVVFAQEEADSLGHTRVGTEHLLLGLIRTEDETTAPVLAEAGLDLEKARERARELVGEDARRRRIPFTRAAKRTLEHALREARDLGDTNIGAEHVLLGLLDDERNGAVRIARDLGADPEALRAAVLARRTA
jgi:Clp amino terminal domain, pathogenicity island component